MLNKYIVAGVLSSATFFAFSSVVSANSINPQAWRGFTQAKQEKYDREHTLDKAPFPQTIEEKNIIKVNLSKLAWAAYDSNGNLVKWGNASGGKNFCDDIGKACKTVTGTYTVYRKQGSACKSNQFPVGKGGAPMPYCMHFNAGYALHGGNVPDFNASHGCIRVPVREAQWLNQNFVNVGSTRISISYQ